MLPGDDHGDDGHGVDDVGGDDVPGGDDRGGGGDYGGDDDDQGGGGDLQQMRVRHPRLREEDLQDGMQLRGDDGGVAESKHIT